jgi:hypothetical protein
MNVAGIRLIAGLAESEAERGIGTGFFGATEQVIGKLLLRLRLNFVFRNIFTRNVSQVNRIQLLATPPFPYRCRI